MDLRQEQEETKRKDLSGSDYVVEVLDLSSDWKDSAAETIVGFYTLEHAKAFARAYVRDSIERCRIPGGSEAEILDAWSAFGEDARVVRVEGGVEWQSSDSIMMFIENKATLMERDWRKLDPRRLVEEDEFFEEDEE